MSYQSATMSNAASSAPSTFESSLFDYRSLLPTRSLNASTSSERLDEEGGDGGGGSSGWFCSEWLPQLSWRERVLGCATCMIAGYLLSFGSFWRVGALLRGNPVPFVLNATVGNILALTGSCFLSSPSSQLKRMWNETRKVATVLYLGSLAATVVLILLPVFTGQALLILLLFLCQQGAVFWYTLSYIPFAREAIINFANRRMGSTEY